MISPGRLIYKLWWEPLGTVQRSLAEGGTWGRLKTARAREEMEICARSLPPSPAPLSEQPRCQLWFLTGQRFWYQTAFCLRSFETHSGLAIQPTFLDDGSLLGDPADQLRHIFPAAVIRSQRECDAQFHQILPPSRYPTLHERRANYPYLRKLTDVHVGGRGWRLVFDSDMLFFRRPACVIDWLSAPRQPLAMEDIEDSYGYTRPLMESLVGTRLPDRINVGFAGLRSEELDWDLIEHWSAALIAAEGTHYFLEQALVAMLLARSPAIVAPRRDYVLLPDREECRHPTAVLHHYVLGSRRDYFRSAWRHHAP